MGNNINTEIEKIIEVVKTFSYDEQDIFIYSVIFNHGIKKIASLTLINDMDVYKTLIKIHEKLIENDCTNKKNWEKAMYDYMCHRIKISAPPMELFEQSCKYEFNYPDITESLLFASELPKPKKTQIILTKLKRYVPVAIFTLFLLVASAGTGYAMARLGLIQISHEKSADLYIIPDGEQLADEIQTQHEVVETLYLPKYVPRNYTFSEQINTIGEHPFIQTFYTDKFEDYILEFQQNTNQIIIDLDNENTISKNIDINGNQGLFQEKHNSTILIWSDGNYFYSLLCNSPDIDFIELKKIAESVKEISQ